MWIAYYDQIIIHAATADHLPSARAVVRGIKNRADKTKKVIYLHTSGAGVIAQDPRDPAGIPPPFSDLDPERIDKDVKDTADHREIDLHIRNELGNAQAEKQHNALVAILMPPVIYGLGTGPFNKDSILVPALCKATVNLGTGISVGEGKNSMDAVHVQDLADAFLIIITEMEKAEASAGLYWFTETDHVEAYALSQLISTVLERHGRSDGKVIQASPEDHDVIIKAFASFLPPGTADADVETKAQAAGVLYRTFASAAHSKADRLRGLGWSPRPGRLPILESLENDEIPKFVED